MMSENSLLAGNMFESSDAIEALKELEVSSQSAVMQKRTNSRVSIEIGVLIQPGDSSRRGERAISAATSDLSNTGCRLLSPSPILPGDIYWLKFEANDAGVGSAMARCVRCHMIREGAFEIGLTFFNEIDLTDLV